MTETAIVAIVVSIMTVTGTLLGVWLTQRHESKRKSSDERRWYADYFLGRKIDALHSLHVALVDCHSAMNYYGNYHPSTPEEYREKVSAKEEAFLRAKVIASIYLDKEARETLSSALGAFRQAGDAIAQSIQAESPAAESSIHDSARGLDWKNLTKTYDDAVDCLANLLNPEVLQRVEKPK